MHASFDWRLRRIVRTVVSSMKCSRDFGRQMAKEAKQRRFFEAPAKAFLGDGLPWNWAIWKEHFGDFTPILDFIHPLSYLLLAAKTVHASSDDAGTVTYLKNNRSRMKYPEYRQAGLPVTTAWMESLVNEVNYRVKRTETFWNNPEGAEAILQVRAAALSDDDRPSKYLQARSGCPFTRRPKLPESPAEICIS